MKGSARTHSLHRIWMVRAATAVLVQVLLLLSSGAAAVTSPGTAVVQTDTAFIEALQNSSVVQVQIPKDITLLPDTFQQLSSPILVTRNVTVRGNDLLPIFNMSYISGKLLLAPGVVFTFDSLFIQRDRFESLTLGPDIFAYSPNTTVVMQNSALLWDSCTPLDMWTDTAKAFPQIDGPGIPSVPRPQISHILSQGSCHPETQQCWPSAGVAEDVLTEMWATDQQRIPGTGWAYWFRNQTFVCTVPVTSECIQTHTLKNCLVIMREYARNQPPNITHYSPPPWLPAPAAPPNDFPGPSQPSSGGGGLSSSTKTAVIVSVVVGTAGLALLVSAVLLVASYRRRARAASQAAMEGIKVIATEQEVDGKVRTDGSFRSTSSHSNAIGTKGIILDARATHADGGSQGVQSASLNGSQTPSVARSNKAPAEEPLCEIKQLMNKLGSSGDKLIVLEKIGEGGYAVVYRGRWRNLDVAVKTLYFQAGPAMQGENKAEQGMHQRQRVLWEAAVCSSIVHPNVVATYHYDVVQVQAQATKGLAGMEISDNMAGDFKLYLVQEFCNASLSEVLDRGMLHEAPDRPYRDVFALLADVARGVNHVHEHNIVHGDLTPNNILLHVNELETGPSIFAKICDFGLSQSLAPGRTHVSNITRGTPFYVAPEVVKQHKLTTSSDAWSWGIIAWEVYHNRRPFVWTEDAQHSRSYKWNPHFPKWQEAAPARLIKIVHSCLHKDPAKRPNFREILEEMELLVEETKPTVAGLAVPPAAGESLPVNISSNRPSSVQVQAAQQGEAQGTQGQSVAETAETLVELTAASLDWQVKDGS